MEKNITLIGMMGAGKSSVAEFLAEQISGYLSIDSDNIIQSKINMMIPDIFKIKGEKFFRDTEKKIIKKIYTRNRQIIALGGGAFEDKENQDLILHNSIVIYLQASPQILYSRLQKSYHRPLLGENFTIETIKNILVKREKNYKLANLTINTDNKDAQSIATEITGLLHARS